MPAYRKTSPKTGRVSWFAIFYYTDWTGTRRQKKKEGFQTRRDALAFEHDFLERQAAAPTMTFGALCDLYFEDYRERHRPRSFETSQNTVRNHILPFFRDIPINNITPASVRKWESTIQKKKLRPATLATVFRKLNAIMNHAVKFYGLPANPCRAAGGMGSNRPHEMTFWTAAQFKQFQATFEETDIFKTAFTLLFYAGIRRGELLALTPADFDFKTNILTISKSYARIARKDVIQPPKTEKGNRRIILPPFVMEMVKGTLARLNHPTPEQRIFDAVTVTALRGHFIKASDKAGLPRIRIHDLRHSHASLLIEEGFAPLVIKERLGHESIQTTLDVYAHLYESKQQEISDKLQAVGST